MTLPGVRQNTQLKAVRSVNTDRITEARRSSLLAGFCFPRFRVAYPLAFSIAM